MAFNIQGNWFYQLRKINPTTGAVITFNSWTEFYNAFRNIDITAQVGDLDQYFNQIGTEVLNKVLLNDGTHTMQASFDMGVNKITNLASGTLLSDAANRGDIYTLGATTFISFAMAQNITDAQKIIAQKNIGLYTIPSRISFNPNTAIMTYGVGNDTSVANTVNIQPSVSFAYNPATPQHASREGHITGNIASATVDIDLKVYQDGGLVGIDENGYVDYIDFLPRGTDINYREGQVVQYDSGSVVGGGILPAVDGSRLTNLSSTQFTGQGNGKITRVLSPNNVYTLSNGALSGNAITDNPLNAGQQPVSLLNPLAISPQSGFLFNDLFMQNTHISGGFGYPLKGVSYTSPSSRSIRNPRFFADGFINNISTTPRIDVVQSHARYWLSVSNIKDTSSPALDSIAFCPDHTTTSSNKSLNYFDVYTPSKANPYASNGLLDDGLAWKWRRFYTPVGFDKVIYLSSGNYIAYANNSTTAMASEQETAPTLWFSSNLSTWTQITGLNLVYGDAVIDAILYRNNYYVLLQRLGNLLSFQSPTANGTYTSTPLLGPSSFTTGGLFPSRYNYKYVSLNSDSLLCLEGYYNCNKYADGNTYQNAVIWKSGDSSWFVNTVGADTSIESSLIYNGTMPIVFSFVGANYYVSVLSVYTITPASITMKYYQLSLNSNAISQIASEPITYTATNFTVPQFYYYNKKQMYASGSSVLGVLFPTLDDIQNSSFPAFNKNSINDTNGYGLTQNVSGTTSLALASTTVSTIDYPQSAVPAIKSNTTATTSGWAITSPDINYAGKKVAIKINFTAGGSVAQHVFRTSAGTMFIYLDFVNPPTIGVAYSVGNTFPTYGTVNPSISNAQWNAATEAMIIMNLNQASGDGWSVYINVGNTWTCAFSTTTYTAGWIGAVNTDFLGWTTSPNRIVQCSNNTIGLVSLTGAVIYAGGDGGYIDSRTWSNILNNYGYIYSHSTNNTVISGTSKYQLGSTAIKFVGTYPTITNRHDGIMFKYIPSTNNVQGYKLSLDDRLIYDGKNLKSAAYTAGGEVGYKYFLTEYYNGKRTADNSGSYNFSGGMYAFDSIVGSSSSSTELLFETAISGTISFGEYTAYAATQSSPFYSSSNINVASLTTSYVSPTSSPITYGIKFKNRASNSYTVDKLNINSSSGAPTYQFSQNGGGFSLYGQIYPSRSETVRYMDIKF